MKDVLCDHDLEIYGKLYEQIALRKEVRISEEAFLACIGDVPGQSDLSGLFGFDNLQFLYASYELLFYRLPDEKTERKWEVEAKRQSSEEFRKKLLSQLIQSQEYDLKGRRMIHNIYLLHKFGKSRENRPILREEAKAIAKGLIKKLPGGVYDFLLKSWKKLRKYD